MKTTNLSIKALDGYDLSATLFEDKLVSNNDKVLMISSATAVPQRYYKPLAKFFAENGYTVLTYDYRGISGSKKGSLKGFTAKVEDWVLQDMAGMVEWVCENLNPNKFYHLGHSYGGQTAGLLPNGKAIDAMVTIASQSGYWKLQGGFQKIAVCFHAYFSLPVLSNLFGYAPWSKFSSAEDLPKNIAIKWAKWCRSPNYLLDDPTLPLERFSSFKAPVLAYSFSDDDWGTTKAVDAMMKAYPNLQRRHISPSEAGMEKIGHFGFFRPKAITVWNEALNWFGNLDYKNQSINDLEAEKVF